MTGNEERLGLPTVVLADALSLVGEVVGRLLQRRLQVLSVVDTSDEFIEAVRASHPDVAIVDLALGAGALDVLQQLRKEGLSARFIVTCDHESPAAAEWVMACGADAFVPKQRGVGELLRAIDAALSGRRYITQLAPQHDRDSDVVRLQRLTKRQKEIARCVLLGYAAKQIAIELNMSRRTVEAHRTTIIAIFNSKNVFELRARLRPLAGML